MIEPIRQLETIDLYASDEAREPVSILIAAYGRLPLLKRAVASALEQRYPSFEVVVIDDGSDDETRSWLSVTAAQHDRLRVIFQNHQGVAAARARGVEEAVADLICILDSDDTLVPHALERLTAELREHPDAVLVHSSIKESRPNGVTKVPKYRGFRTARGMLWATLLTPRVPFKHSGTLFRRSTAISLGSYDSRLPCKVDIDLYLKFLTAGHRPRFIAEPLVHFLMSKNSVSRDRMLGLRVWFRLIDRYGPRSTLVRAGIKAARSISETLKLIYIRMG